MNRARLETLLADDGALLARGRKSAIHSAKREAMDDLRAATQAVLGGSTASTKEIRQACDALDWLATLEAIA